MCKYFVLFLVVLCGCSKNTQIDQKQDASMPQLQQIVTSEDAEALLAAIDKLNVIEEVDVLELILRDRDKWFAYYEYKEPDISQEAIRKIDKVYTLKTMDELLDRRYSSNIFHYSYDEYGIKAYHARDYFFKANEYRDKQDFENALKYYEIALSVYDWSAFYYHYGSLLMDMGDYENAERAFNKAAKEIYWYDPYSLIAPYYPKRGRNNIYSFDSSGIVRELYFTYYNLACLYSIENKLQESEDNVILALENGYPYLDHIFADTDLENLFNAPNAGEIKDRINQVYSDGMVNTVSGKTFEYMPGPNDFVEYEFVNDKEVKLHLLTSDDLDHIEYGFYIVKNYHVIIYYNRVTGQKGYGEAFNAGVRTGYKNYAPYDESIEDFEYVSLAYMATRGNGWGWKEK